MCRYAYLPVVCTAVCGISLVCNTVWAHLLTATVAVAAHVWHSCMVQSQELNYEYNLSLAIPHSSLVYRIMGGGPVKEKIIVSEV